MRNTIKQIVENLGISPNFKFIYGLKSFANMMASDCVETNVVVCLPVTKVKESKSGALKREVNIKILFLSRIDYTTDYDLHSTVIDTLEPFVDSFINTITATEGIKVISSFNQDEVANDLDDNYTGLFIEGTIQDLTYYSGC